MRNASVFAGRSGSCWPGACVLWSGSHAGSCTADGIGRDIRRRPAPHRASRSTIRATQASKVWLLEEIARSLGVPLDLSQYQIDPFYPAWMKAANIQHIELRQTGDGIALLVNGALMPSLSFQDGSLQRISDLAPLLGPERAGDRAAAREVRAAGPAPRPVHRAEVPQARRRAGHPVRTGGRQGGRSSSRRRSASAVAKFEIKYDDQGVPSILGISARDLQALGVNANVALAPERAGATAGQQRPARRSSAAAPTVCTCTSTATRCPPIAWDGQALTMPCRSTSR